MRRKCVGLPSVALDSGIQAGMTNNGVDRYGAPASWRLLCRSGGAWRTILMSNFTQARTLQQRPPALERRAVRDDAGGTVKALPLMVHPRRSEAAPGSAGILPARRREAASWTGNKQTRSC
jgi:hypothetical protein